MKNEYVSEYFYRAQEIVSKFNPNNKTVIQFFQRKNDCILSGINESLEFLKENLKGKDLVIKYLPEGSHISEKEVVLEIEGRYQDFGIYEGIIDGILSRSTSIATNSYKCVKEAKGKEVICMSDRSDHWCNQERDGKAMAIGGITSYSSYAQSSLPSHLVYGSIPHALIQNFKGNLVKVMRHYSELFPNEELVALVDFHNDVIKDSLEVLREFGKKLKGVRVDTSKKIRDFMFKKEENEYGVTPNQIKNLRKALDENDGKHVKIYVSSGFTPEKINLFEKENTPVDGYGVGEYLLNINVSFCADCVKINGEEYAKEGRGYRRNDKLITYKWE